MRFVPFFAVLGSVTSLQLGASLASTLFPVIGAAGASALRLSISALVLVALTRPRVRSWTRGQWTSVALLGLALAGMNGAFYEAVSRIPLGAAVTLEFLGPLGLAAVLSRRPRDLLWVAMALAGVAVLGVEGFDQPLTTAGVAWALVAAAFWAAYILAGARVASADVGMGGLAAASVVSGLLTLPLGVVSAGSALLSWPVLVTAVGMAVLASVIPYSLELFALGRMPKKTFSVLLALEPAVAALAGAALLGQGVGVGAVVAIVLVIVAGVGATLASPPREPKAESVTTGDRAETVTTPTTTLQPC
ncbi:EamA family transporter [Cryptosporangium aurantiacum]|uniref:Inner membrane transporter RhtA n=1 Tax=Cryptosporangium aurantiacum TaxID=134849 RepID=A0A1M7MHC4_9ACTN|nr:EamA family transporter [Cryptosporangium aurantiacum]SHM90221.1 inner membrane transporter RhtA [Cryptosporangium aurantiacum]